MSTLHLKKLFSSIGKRKRSPLALSSSSTNSKMAFHNLFSSSRLVYRALENTDRNKEFFTKSILNNPVSYAHCWDVLMKPPSSESVKNTIEWIKDLLAVTICLPSPGESPAHSANPMPIGWLNLSANSGTRHHRSCTLAITIWEPHQGKGYGTEDWALNWAFSCTQCATIEEGVQTELRVFCLFCVPVVL